MNAKNLSPRLEKVAQLLVQFGPKPLRLADIGSDHAYLPSYLGLEGHLDFGLAGEVVDGPYQSAVKEVSSLGLNDLIDVRKGDGLAVIQPQDQINAVSICGMGGSLIATILDQGFDRLNPGTILALQPNIASHHVRRLLLARGARIMEDLVLEDGGRYYEIIIAKLGDPETQPYTEVEIRFGRHNLQTKKPDFIKKWSDEYKALSKVYQEIVKAKGVDHPSALAMTDKLSLIKEAIQDDSDF
ncbi:TPA: tRNA (adenine(22)-N(1))-methyltransferase TrmK [Streptococcus suis]